MQTILCCYFSAEKCLVIKKRRPALSIYRTWKRQFISPIKTGGKNMLLTDAEQTSYKHAHKARIVVLHVTLALSEQDPE
jgi:hypothetical protein